MADQVSFSIITKPFTDEMKAQHKRVDRASMYGLREVGRRVKREARKEAPRLSGAYRSSIKSSRRLKSTLGGGYSVKVGPRGGVLNPQGASVHLYAGKIEAKDAPMHKAYDRTVPEMASLLAKAWGKAMNRR